MQVRNGWAPSVSIVNLVTLQTAHKWDRSIDNITLSRQHFNRTCFKRKFGSCSWCIWLGFQLMDLILEVQTPDGSSYDTMGSELAKLCLCIFGVHAEQAILQQLLPCGHLVHQGESLRQDGWPRKFAIVLSKAEAEFGKVPVHAQYLYWHG